MAFSFELSFHLNERYKLTDDEPDVDGQVHGEGSLEEEGLEEGGGKGDEEEQERRQEGGHHLAQDYPLHNNPHPNALSRITLVSEFQAPICQSEKIRILVLFHPKVFWRKDHSELVLSSDCHIDRTHLRQVLSA